MEIRARLKDKVVILDLYGKIDVDSANLVEAIGQCIYDGYCDILCNFEDIDSIDYMGISALALAYREVINHNGRMKFVNIPAHLRALFSIAGLDKTIDVYASEDLAIDSFREDKVIEDIKKLQLRRRFKRLPIELKIRLRDEYHKDLSPLKLDILNLSAVGAYIYGCDRFKLGDRVILELQLSPNQKEIELEARVVWLSDKQIQPHIHPGMGIEFCNLSPSVQEELIEFIERNISFMSTDE